ncbi:hypothetical protein AQUCO_07200072v1 [Aquilegia coerulea]|uniref:RRM domain-containing protein n=1 Tax=Aquilegia coerulea TaxID=218851 RepID=A0A2G5CA79_AQUCA|nr:hypothetical protein AQUCO_07200072v1 [Aquilegia coerulea]
MAAFRGITRALTQRSLLSNPSATLLQNHHPAQFISYRGIASKLFIGGLSFYTTEQSLSEAFSQFGQVVEATIISDRASDRSKGFGFVTFASEDEAQKAITEMNGKVLNGRVIYVETAKPTRSRYRDEMPIARGPPESMDLGL